MVQQVISKKGFKMEKLYTVAETATALRVSVMTIYRHLKSGKLRGRRSGWIWVFTQDNIDDYLNASTTKEGLDGTL